MDLKALKDYVDQIDQSRDGVRSTLESDQVALITITKWEGDVEINRNSPTRSRALQKGPEGSD